MVSGKLIAICMAIFFIAPIALSDCIGPKILVVSDNDAAYYETKTPDDSNLFIDILGRNGFCVSYWQEKQQGVPELSYLNSFDAVVWSAGDYFDTILGATDRALLKAYNGNILFEGSDLVFNSAGDLNLLTTKMHIKFKLDRQLTELTKLQKTTSDLLWDVGDIDINHQLAPYPDSYTTHDGESIANWHFGGSAITIYQRYNRSAIMGFSIDAINSPVARERLIVNLMKWVSAVPAGYSVPTDGQTITSSTNFLFQPYIFPNGLKVRGDNITINCNNSQIDGNMGEIGFDIRDSNNVRIERCGVRNFLKGFAVENSGSFLLTDSNTLSTSKGVEVKSSKSPVLFQNFIMQSSGIGAELSGVSGINIYDNNFIANKNALVAYDVNSGFVQKNLFKNTDENAVSLYRADRVAISDDIIKSTGLTGVYMQDSTLSALFSTTLDGAGFAGAHFRNSHAGGMIFANLSNSPFGVLFENSPDNEISTHWGSSNSISAIALKDSPRVLLSGVTIDGSAASAVDVENSNDVNIIGGKISSSLDGIRLYKSNNARVLQTRLAFNQYGLRLVDSNAGVFLDNNFFRNYTAGVGFEQGSTLNSVYRNRFYQAGVLGASGSGNIFCVNNVGNLYFEGATGPTCTDTDIPPRVAITSPANNSIYTAPATVVISADAFDSDGSVSRVEFYNGEQLLAIDFTAPYTYTWNNVPIGNYTLWAKAYDDLNVSSAFSDANSSHITVNPDTSLYSLTVTKFGSGSGRVTSSVPGIDCVRNCSALYPAGTVVTLNATPAQDSELSYWAFDCKNKNPCTVTMDSNKSVAVLFAASLQPCFTTINDDLWGYYCFDNKYYDSSGHGTNGDGYNVTLEQLEGGNKVAVFNGVDSYVEIPDDPLLRLGESTVSFWFNPGVSDGSVQSIIRKGVMGYNEYYIDYRYGTSFKSWNSGYDPNGNYWDCEPQFGMIPNNGKWHHVAQTRDLNGNFSFYVDGKKVGGHSCPISSYLHSSDYPDWPNNLWIGANYPSQSYRMYKGELDEIMLYSRALSTADIGVLYAQTKGLFPAAPIQRDECEGFDPKKNSSGKCFEPAQDAS